MNSRHDIAGGRFSGREAMTATVARAAGSPPTTRTPVTRTTAPPSPWSAQSATTEWFVPTPPPKPAGSDGPPTPPAASAARWRGRRTLAAAASVATLAAAVTISALLVPGDRPTRSPDASSQLAARAAGSWVNHYALAGSHADYQLTIDGRRWHLTGEDYVVAGARHDGIRQTCSGTVTADDYQLTFATATRTAEPIGSGLPGRQTGGSFCAGTFNAVLYPAGQALDLIDPKSVRTYQLRRP